MAVPLGHKFQVLFSVTFLKKEEMKYPKTMCVGVRILICLKALMV